MWLISRRKKRRFATDILTRNDKMPMRIAASSSKVLQNNLSSRSRVSGRGISISLEELIKKDVIKD
jgi:hypothetical protein